MHSKNPDVKERQRVNETGPKDLLILLEISQEGDEGLNFLLFFWGGELSIDVVVAVQSLSHVRLCNPMDCITPGSSVHGILQARILEWVAIPFSRGIFPTQGSNLHFLHWQEDSLPPGLLGSPSH